MLFFRLQRHKCAVWGSTSRLFSLLPACRRCNSSGHLCTIRQSLSIYKTGQPSSRRERNGLGRESDAPSGGVIAGFIQYTMLTLYDVNPDWCHILMLSHTSVLKPHKNSGATAAYSIQYTLVNEVHCTSLHRNQIYIRDEIRSTVG